MTVDGGFESDEDKLPRLERSRASNNSWESGMSSEQPEAPSREPIDQIRPDIIKVMAIRAAIQLGVFTPLGDGPLSAEELGRHWA